MVEGNCCLQSQNRLERGGENAFINTILRDFYKIFRSFPTLVFGTIGKLEIQAIHCIWSLRVPWSPGTTMLCFQKLGTLWRDVICKNCHVYRGFDKKKYTMHWYNLYERTTHYHFTKNLHIIPYLMIQMQFHKPVQFQLLTNYDRSTSLFIGLGHFTLGWAHFYE